MYEKTSGIEKKPTNQGFMNMLMHDENRQYGNKSDQMECN